MSPSYDNNSQTSNSFLESDDEDSLYVTAPLYGACTAPPNAPSAAVEDSTINPDATSLPPTEDLVWVSGIVLPQCASNQQRSNEEPCVLPPLDVTWIDLDTPPTVFARLRPLRTVTQLPSSDDAIISWPEYDFSEASDHYYDE